jgi:2-polyprenyl-6-methoxyphenol hydroxylase-like FAD-dependent oxidoreductase
MTANPIGKTAIVLGGSLAGMFAARVLSAHFEEVVVVEKDKMNDQPESRKGQPQTRHIHALLAKGLEIFKSYFPGLVDDLQAHGAQVGDPAIHTRWFDHGGYRKRFNSDLLGVSMSRPLLEWQIRRRVLALPNVRLMDETDVESLETMADRSRVTGARVTIRKEGNAQHTLQGDLIVDALGRGSPSPKWLEALGYDRPAESVVKVNFGYATRIYERRLGDPNRTDLIFTTPTPPHDKRGGGAFPVEGDRWIVTLGGWAGDHPPLDEQGYIEFARTLDVPDIYQLVTTERPLSDIVPHKLPSSVRKHYEKMARFPAGYLVVGDAIASFNPIYGQGMTSAALQIEFLDQVLRGARERGHLNGIAPEFFKRAAQIVDVPWQLAVGADFMYPETEGPKPPGTDFINRYVARLHRATHTDTVVYGAFLKVAHLLSPPATLFHPRIVWRVLTAKPAVAQEQPQTERATAYS